MKLFLGENFFLKSDLKCIKKTEYVKFKNTEANKVAWDLYVVNKKVSLEILINIYLKENNLSRQYS